MCSRRAHHFSKPTEAALATGVFGNGTLQDSFVQIWPEIIQKYVFGIRRLPGQETRHPLLAGCPDHQIRIGNAARVEGCSEDPFVDRLGRQLACQYTLWQVLGGTYDFLPSAAIESDNQVETDIVARACVLRTRRSIPEYQQTAPRGSR